MSGFEQPRETVERNSFVQRIQDLGGQALALAQGGLEALTPTTPLAYAAAGVLAVGGAAYEAATPALAEAHANHGMAPSSTLHSIQKIERKSWLSLSFNSPKVLKEIHPYRGSLTDTDLTLKGTCDPKAFIRNVVEDQGKAIQTTCGGYKYKFQATDTPSGRQPYSPHLYTKDLNKLGNKVARSVKVGASKHGEVSKIVTTKKWTRVSFDRNEVTPSSNEKQLKSVVVRDKKRPVFHWYKKLPVAPSSETVS